jgi:hypothetical protein
MDRRDHDAAAAEASANRWCARLGLAALPRVEDFAGRRQTKLFHLMVIALLERGAPMTIEEIAARLCEAGVTAATGDLAHSLRKAWHGLPPVYRLADGRYGIDLESRELSLLLFMAGVTPPRFAPPDPPAPPPEPGDDVPLDVATLDAAFRGRSLAGVSVVRQAAAVLDAHGGPLPLDAVDSVLAGLTPYRAPLCRETAETWPTGLVRIGHDAVLALDHASEGLVPMRRAMRKLARTALVERVRQEHYARIHEERSAILAETERREAAAAAGLRRAVLRVVPGPGAPRAAALLDVAARTVRTFAGAEMPELPQCLRTFDVLAGLHVRDTLAALGLDPEGWRLFDLRPPHRTRRLNRRGRTLAITPERLMAGTLEVSRPLGDPSAVAAYLSSGAPGRLRRRLESDAKALAAFWRYGALHGCVRLRWGFLDEAVPVDWSLPGDPSLHEILAAAHAAGRPVDVVVGAAPGWRDPWSRARRVRVVDAERWRSVVVDDGVEAWEVDRLDIQAIRMADGS